MSIKFLKSVEDYPRLVYNDKWYYLPLITRKVAANVSPAARKTMFAKVNSLGLLGIDGFKVTVEVDLSGGLPKFDIVGLPDTAVKEAKDRVRSAIKNSGFDYPVSRITVNLAPADIKKEGPIYDLPILVGILLASEQIKKIPKNACFIGALSLNGDVSEINGVLPMAIKAKESGYDKIFVPFANAAECRIIEGIQAYAVRNVRELADYLSGKGEFTEVETVPYTFVEQSEEWEDFADVKGQFDARRALEIAAAGGHNVLMVGSPGSGKSMLAKRIPSILPDMTFEEAIEATKIHSIAGELPADTEILHKRPFRSPHHTISPIGLSGGGSVIKPGEISLAHNGVLFLDELPEFTRQAMEILRQPMEDGKITISRVSGTVTYPSRFMTVAAMNPCKCGYYGHPKKRCTCPPHAAEKYMAKISYPLLDRFDIHVDVQSVEYDALSSKEKGESSADIKKRVNKARAIQLRRFAETNIVCNAQMSPSQTRRFCLLTSEAQNALKLAFEKLGLSARAYDKVLRVSKTIADLDGSDIIDTAHILEAVQYRSLDRKYWKKI